jgi:hypothetical protein
MNDDWDGTERRAAVLAVEQAKGNGKTVEIPTTIVLVGFVVVAIRQCAAILGHTVLAREQKQEHLEAQEARRQITCFVVGITQGKPGPDLLSECGFLRIGGR